MLENAILQRSEKSQYISEFYRSPFGLLTEFSYGKLACVLVGIQISNDILVADLNFSLILVTNSFAAYFFLKTKSE